IGSSREPRGPGRSGFGVLIVVQNLSVPLDRRVWLECQALRDAGYRVSVICPAGPGEPRRRMQEGVWIRTYRPAPVAVGLAGYAVEFLYSWLCTAWLSLLVWRERGFSVIQACNPPDTYWALARLWRFRGVRFVFDHHDLNPELFLSRFGAPRGLLGRAQLAGLTWLERRTFATADRVISTNESYRQVALGRGGQDPARVTVVRSGPDTSSMRPIWPAGRPAPGYQLVYLGIMGPQDGVDQALLVMDELVNVRRRADIQLSLLGFGDCFDQLRAQAADLGLDQNVTFTGRADPAMVADYLSAADVGVCPDLKTPLNDVSTMNKVMEYMAYFLPSVSFDLRESRVTAGDTAVFVESGDIRGFADAICALLDDDAQRLRMGRAARARVATELDWSPQSARYVRVFDELVGPAPRPKSRVRAPSAPPAGREFVALEDPAELRAFLASRARSTHHEVEGAAGA
ncbi:MAG TPA: glycosyltransferase family 4 protein, partial [Pedococcus sp.]|nr:glycosyltransferase family 4 protein [Pedococcus sp.]